MPIALFAIAGGLIGGGIAASIWGFAAFATGWAIGSLIGQLLAPKPTQYVTGPRLENTSPAVSNIIGNPIQIPYGLIRMPGSIIWSNSITEREIVQVQKTKGGSLGGSKKTVTRTYEYYLDFAVAIAEGPILGIRKVWANNKIIYDQDGEVKAEPWLKFTLYEGTETQEPDPLMEGILGFGNVPAYRGLAYIVFEQFKLEEYGNRAPYSIEFEVATELGYLKVPAVEYLHQGSGGGDGFHHDQIRYIAPNGDILAGLTGDTDNWGVTIPYNAPQALRLHPIPPVIKTLAARDNASLGKSSLLGRTQDGYFVVLFPFRKSPESASNKTYIGFFNGSLEFQFYYGPVGYITTVSRIIFDKYFITTSNETLNTVGLTPSINWWYINIYGGSPTVSGGGDEVGSLGKTIRFRSSPPLQSSFGETIGHVTNFDFSENKSTPVKSWQALGPNVIINSYSQPNIYATIVTTNDAKIGNNITPPNTDVMIYRYSEADMISASYRGELSYFRLNPWVRLNNENLSVTHPEVTVPAEFMNFRSVLSAYIIDNNIWIFGLVKVSAFSMRVIAYKVAQGTALHTDGYYEPSDIYICPHSLSTFSGTALANQYVGPYDSGVQYGKGYLDSISKTWTVMDKNIILVFNFNTNTWQTIQKENVIGMQGGFEYPFPGGTYIWLGIESQPRAELQYYIKRIIKDTENPLTVDAVISNICERAGLTKDIDFSFVTCCPDSGGLYYYGF
jgi:hypothetical protein